MFAVSESEKPAPVKSSRTTHPRVDSSSLPPQWKRYRNTKKKKVPLFLRALLFLQYTSALLTVGTIGASLVVYGLSYYTQQQWNESYEQLMTLQRHERNLTVINESLQDQITREGNRQNDQWIPLTPDKNIYLEPTPADNLPETSQVNREPEEASESPSTERPLGY